MMDINKDGTIDKNDLRGAFDNVGVLMTESELDELLGEVGGACTRGGGGHQEEEEEEEEGCQVNVSELLDSIIVLKFRLCSNLKSTTFFSLCIIPPRISQKHSHTFNNKFL